MMTYYWIAGVVLTILFSVAFNRRLHFAVSAMVAALFSCMLLIAGVFIFENGSNLWPFSFVIFGIPLFVLAIVVNLVLNRVYTKRS